MWRVALARAVWSGAFTSFAGVIALGKAVEQTGDNSSAYVGPVIVVAVISGVTTIIVALIYVAGPQLLKRRSERDPAFRQSHDEATDALVTELVRKEQELQKVKNELRAERDRRVDPPRRQMVSRRVYAVTVVLLVVMMGASDVAIILIAPSGPTAAQVQAQVNREFAQRSQVRDGQFCRILSALPRTALSDVVRRTLGCSAALPSKTVKPRTPAQATPSTVIVKPGPTTTATATVTKTVRPTPGPGATVTVTPPCRGVKVNGGCVPTHVPPVPIPTVPLR